MAPATDVDNVKANKRYENPIEQVMFILGLKHDPQFESPLHAIAHGSNPGITNTLDQLTAYGAIEANFHAWTKTVKWVRDSEGKTLSSEHRDELCRAIADELDEKHYGGRWFGVDTIPSAHWISMERHSPVFVRENQVFYLPEPYGKVFEPLFASSVGHRTHETKLESVDSLARALVDGATELAVMIGEQLDKFSEGIDFRDASAGPQFAVEVIVFYLHLIDRLAFRELGAAKRNIFCDRLASAVTENLTDDLRESLHETYNRRQMQYGKCKVLFPKKGDPLKDTIFWEFSKILFGFFDITNPATLMLINTLVADTTVLMLNDVLHIEDVLKELGT